MPESIKVSQYWRIRHWRLQTHSFRSKPLLLLRPILVAALSGAEKTSCEGEGEGNVSGGEARTKDKTSRSSFPSNLSCSHLPSPSSPTYLHVSTIPSNRHALTSGEQSQNHFATLVRGVAMLEGEHSLESSRDARTHREHHPPICQEQGRLVHVGCTLQQASLPVPPLETC